MGEVGTLKTPREHGREGPCLSKKRLIATFPVEKKLSTSRQQPISKSSQNGRGREREELVLLNRGTGLEERHEDLEPMNDLSTKSPISITCLTSQDT